MDRRRFLGFAATGLMGGLRESAMGARPRVRRDEKVIQVKVHDEAVLGVIPRDFIGLGYEISSVARPNLLSATNQVYVQMVKTLGAAGVIRVGGNTADYSTYREGGPAVSAPKSTVVDRESLRQLGTFLEATGWTLIWGLNLGQGTEREAIEEAQAVSEAAKQRLLALEIGNEVDLFPHEGHRQASYDFGSYLQEYRRFKKLIREKLPHAMFAGPDVAGETDWVRQFADAEAGDLKLLTHHYYRGGQSPASSLEMLFQPDPKLAPILSALRATSSGCKVPYRICETNSFSGGGRPGVSGTFGAALWVLDYMFTLASYDAAGVNIETGVNQRGFVSSYSPIGDDEHGTYRAMPEFYGMLAFSQASDGRRVAVEAERGGYNVSSYAVRKGREVVVTLINKDQARRVSIEVACGGPIGRATAMRLVGPSLTSATGVTLGGASVTADGQWRPGPPEVLRRDAAGVHIALPEGSAALVTLEV